MSVHLVYLIELEWVPWNFQTSVCVLYSIYVHETKESIHY